MRYGVRLHEAVAGDLETIARLIADHAGREVAVRKLTEIRRTLESLSQPPHRGTLRDALAPGLRAIPAGRCGVVVFRVEDAAREVVVLAVAYGGADWTARAALGLRRRGGGAIAPAPIFG